MFRKHRKSKIFKENLDNSKETEEKIFAKQMPKGNQINFNKFNQNQRKPNKKLNNMK